MSRQPYRQPWTPQQDDWLRELYPETNNQLIAKMMGRKYASIKNRATALGLKKSPEYLEREKPGCFKPGQKSWNKGLSYQPGGRIKDSQYRKGSKPHNTIPVGTEVVDSYGYRKRKVRDDAPVGKAYQNWRFVHVLVWEKHNGPLPRGHVVRFRDGDQANTDPGNLVAVSRAENAVINKLYQAHDLPAEGFDVMLNLARLKILEKQRKREIRETQAC